jgi:hypothetical protein
MPFFGLYTTNEVAAMLQTIIANQTRGLTLMSQISDQVNAIRQQVAANTTVEGSALVLIQQIAAKLQAALDNAKDDAQAVSDLQALTTQLKASADPLAAAVTANTPAQ